MTLYQQIQNYNSLLDAVDALDEAQRSGGTKRLKNKEQMMEAFKVMRADLICALRIEKIFRENPKLQSTDFNMNLEPLKIMRYGCRGERPFAPTDTIFVDKYWCIHLS
ncbi:hypothetical protein PN466_22325 [Roseofilum reptotaenium CS-1145]|uniref:Uncharacterized protein n=1 Tax=Roseofilum reptotaenium AO1-A TaxID=1925591 RepID=A0A1L9QN88_9CYAN|nr:hypothetical protein [Roseofilum reptotaenium]MDB9519683.1 hypothetical protein [Roseofilum reptotaenium CS-1145]OJJ24134.1 hypothetical protein BI308_18340 [Roseofilum reptotaenium AO1-A]